jgi:hypothetical protein
VYPARHVQDVSSGLFADEKVLFGHTTQVAAAADEYTFTPQAVHIALPVTFLNVPAAHSVQAVPSAPVNLAIHVHDVLIVPPTAEKVLAGHEVQLVATANE